MSLAWDNRLGDGRLYGPVVSIGEQGKGCSVYISISDKGGHRILQRQRHAIAKQVMVVAASAVVLGSVLGCQPQVQTIVVEKPKCELREFRSSTKFVTEAWAIPDNRFNVGEPLRLQMRVSFSGLYERVPRRYVRAR